MKLKNKILPLLLLASTAVGCTDGFETINSDPNKLYEVNLQSIFPGTVYKTMNAISELNNNRMWSYSRYITNVAFQTPWNERGDGFYRKFYVEILRDLEELAKAYDDGSLPNSLAVVKTWKAFTYYQLLSLYGPVGLSHAGMDGGTDKRIFDYDSEADAYYSILGWLDQAVDEFDESSTDKILKDPVYNGDVQKWRKLANTLRLEIAMNIQNISEEKAREYIEDKPNYTFVRADICDFEKMLELMRQYHIDGIIHLAAESHVDRSIKDPFTFARTNVMGTLSLLQAAKIYWEGLPEGYEGKRFYHISTDEVYGALELTHPEGVKPPFTTTASSSEHHLAYGEDFFYEDTKYNPHSPYSASKASSDHFVRAFHDTYGMPTIVTNCSNNYGPYQFPEKLIPLFINNIRHCKPLPVYGKGENVRDWLFVEDHVRAIDLIFHQGKVTDTYNIGGFNEWKNIDIIKVIIKTVDRLLGNPEGTSLDLITFVTDRKGHDMRYAIDSSKLQKELGWEPSLQFEEGIEKTVRWYLDNQEWMDNITSGEYEKYYEEMYRGR